MKIVRIEMKNFRLQKKTRSKKTKKKLCKITKLNFLQIFKLN